MQRGARPRQRKIIDPRAPVARLEAELSELSAGRRLKPTCLPEGRRGASSLSVIRCLDRRFEIVSPLPAGRPRRLPPPPGRLQHRPEPTPSRFRGWTIWAFDPARTSSHRRTHHARIRPPARASVEVEHRRRPDLDIGPSAKWARTCAARTTSTPPPTRRSPSARAPRLRWRDGRPPEGSRTLLGVTRPVVLTISRFHCAPHPLNKRESCGADIVASLRRSEFGMTKYIPSVGDDVRLLIAVEAFRD